MKRLILSKQDRKRLLLEVWDYYGSKSATARALGVDRSTVSTWVAHGEIPARRGVEIERETQGAIRAVHLAAEIEG